MYAPIIIARPKLSASAAAKNAKAKARAISAPGTLKPSNTRDIVLASTIPTIIKPNQNPSAFPAITVTSVKVTLPVALIPTTIVSTRIPNTSSTTAAARTVTPSGLAITFRSLSTLAVIPTEVAVSIAPMNNAFGSPILSANPKRTVAATPRTKGSISPPMATAEAGPANRRNCFRLVSRPAENNKTIAAICPNE